MHRNHNKKEFQSNYNRPLTDRTGYILNKFDHVGGGGGVPGSEDPVEQV